MNPFEMRIGNGYDSHRFDKNRKLIIGGIQIDHPQGLAGHSDADVLLHAIGDALLGSLSLGDLGTHFPDTHKKWRDSDSGDLLRHIFGLIKERDFIIANIDTTIIAEQPKIKPYIAAIRENIADTLDIEIDRISVKATTNEKMGWIGRGEGIAAIATVLIGKNG